MSRLNPWNRRTVTSPRAPAGAGLAASRFGASTFGVGRGGRPLDLAWVAERNRSRRWAWLGGLMGALAALITWAPASWLAQAVEQASGGQVQLADARGTVWSGDAVLVFGAGAGGRDARALPGRLAWTLGPRWVGGPALAVGLSQACCLNGAPTITLQAGWGQLHARIAGSTQPVPADASWLGQWPAAWLVGLGTPWNTLQPGGAMRLSTQDFGFDWVAGRFALRGSATIEARDFSSRIATLPRLGSYRLVISADPAQAGTAQVGLTTLDGALQLSGTGSWGATGLRLRGEASAREADQPALNNLLNIIGRRDGARSLLSIG